MKTKINNIIHFFINKQFIKFAVVGFINTVSFFILSFLLDYILSPIISYSLSFLICLFISYTLNAYWTYKEGFHLKTFILFPLTYIPTYIVQISSYSIFLYNIHLDITISKVLSVALGVPISYIFLTYVFKGKIK